MGVASIMKSRTVYLLAWGQHKAPTINKALEGDISTAVPATFLQKHPNVKIILDKAAAEQLLKVGDLTSPSSLDPADLAAWTSVSRVLLNLHETITRN